MTDSLYTDGSYLQNNPGWHSEDSPYKVKWIAEMLKRTGVPAQSVAEIGCGSGDILVGLQKLFPQACFAGYEISPQAFALAQPKARPGLSFYLEDLTADPTAKFDLLLVIDIFEHVEDYMGFLKRIRGKGEHVLFHIPLDVSIQMLMRPWLFTEIRERLGHIHYFSKQTALDTLRDCGYEIIDWNYTFWSLDYPHLSLRSKLASFPRQLLAKLSPDLAMAVLGGGSLLVLAR